MALLAAFPAGWDLSVLATDLSTKVLERARAAVGPLERSAPIPPAWLRSFMLRGFGAQEGLMKAGPEIRALVTFERVNLVGEGWPAGPFDLVFCRNVLIYFDREAKARVVDRLLDRLAPCGMLLLGHAESLAGLTGRARSVLPTVYVPAGSDPSP
jgi:chemotaxis protein methyltransferase CheR